MASAEMLQGEKEQCEVQHRRTTGVRDIIGENLSSKSDVVEMLGQSYQLYTGEPERINRLAVESDRRIKEMSKKVRSFDVQRIAVLSVLQLMDEYDQLRRDYNELVQLLEEK